VAVVILKGLGNAVPVKAHYEQRAPQAYGAQNDAARGAQHLRKRAVHRPRGSSLFARGSRSGRSLKSTFEASERAAVASARDMDSTFLNIKNTLLSNAHYVAEIVTPTLTASKFVEKGVLTPEEFVRAGDQLVLKCPTWAWSSGDADKRRAHLPADKQFLCTKGVPCRKRARALDAVWSKADEEIVDGDWLATGISETPQEYGHMEPASPPMMKPSAPPLAGKPAPSPRAAQNDDDYADLEDFEEDNLAAGDASTAPPLAATSSVNEAAPQGGDDDDDDAILRTRTYNLSVTYDKYYQVPRVWLQGFDEHGKPLEPAAVFEDIAEDYVNRTVTVEAHPHLNIQCASIHPCRHAPTMKKFFDNLTSDGSEARVDMAMFVFLKFISSIVPTIEGDFTAEVKMRR